MGGLSWQVAETLIERKKSLYNARRTRRGQPKFPGEPHPAIRSGTHVCQALLAPVDRVRPRQKRTPLGVPHSLRRDSQPCGWCAHRATAIWQQVQPQFAGSSVTLLPTTHAGHARELAHTLDATRFDALCIVGGDGTIHEVVNGLLTRSDGARFDLGLIPAGTGNTLHEHLGCHDPRQAAEKILRGHTLGLDVIQLRDSAQTRYAINIVGWGAITDITHRSEQLRVLGKARYTIATLCQICRPRLRRPGFTSATRCWKPRCCC